MGLVSLLVIFCVVIMAEAQDTACNDLENEVNEYRRSLTPPLSAHKCDSNLRRMSKAKGIDQTEANKLSHCWTNKKYHTCGNRIESCPKDRKPKSGNGCVYRTFFNGAAWAGEISSGAARCGVRTVVQ